MHSTGLLLYADIIKSLDEIGFQSSLHSTTDSHTNGFFEWDFPSISCFHSTILFSISNSLTHSSSFALHTSIFYLPIHLHKCKHATVSRVTHTFNNQPSFIPRFSPSGHLEPVTYFKLWTNIFNFITFSMASTPLYACLCSSCLNGSLSFNTHIQRSHTPLQHMGSHFISPLGERLYWNFSIFATVDSSPQSPRGHLTSTTGSILCRSPKGLSPGGQLRPNGFGDTHVHVCAWESFPRAWRWNDSQLTRRMKPLRNIPMHKKAPR